MCRVTEAGLSQCGCNAPTQSLVNTCTREDATTDGAIKVATYYQLAYSIVDENFIAKETMDINK